MKIAITGATGFLGRYLVTHLANKGHDLRCWYGSTSDRNGFENAAKLEWMEGRLGDGQATNTLVRGVDAVVHAALAWEGHGSFRKSGEESFVEFIRGNLIGSLLLFEAAFRTQVSRFIFISSCAVHELILGDRLLDETHPLWPTSHYGACKAALEKFVHSYGLGHGWPICALRPTGIYGQAHPPSSSRWYDLITRVMQGEPIAADRGGKEVHAEDVAKATELLLTATAKTVAGQAFNCYDRYIPEQQVAQIAKEISGSSSTITSRNCGPKNQIANDKIRALGMTFGGEQLLRKTITQLVEAHRR